LIKAEGAVHVIVLGQGDAGVFAHQVVKVLTLVGVVHLGKVTPGHPPQKPLFLQ